MADYDQVKFTLVLSDDTERVAFAALLAPLPSIHPQLQVELYDVITLLKLYHVEFQPEALLSRGRILYQSVKKLYGLHASQPWGCALMTDAEARVKKANVSFTQVFVDFFRAPYYFWSVDFPDLTDVVTEAAKVAAIPLSSLPAPGSYFWQYQGWFVEREPFNALFDHLTALAGSPFQATLGNPALAQRTFADMTYMLYLHQHQWDMPSLRRYRFLNSRTVLMRHLPLSSYEALMAFYYNNPYGPQGLLENFNYLSAENVQGIIDFANEFKLAFFQYRGVAGCWYQYLLAHVPSMAIHACTAQQELPSDCDLQALDATVIRYTYLG